MISTRRSSAFAVVHLDECRDRPIRHQVYRRLRDLIVSGHIGRGAQLPSSRALAADLCVSRSTIVAAFEQLTAEGYIRGQVGAGSFVSNELPDDLLRADRAAVQTHPALRGPRRVSMEGQRLRAVPANWMSGTGSSRPFALGMPAIDEFPYGVWTRLMTRRWQRPNASLSGYGVGAGLRQLRQAVADFLITSRGVRCTAEQIIIVGGSQQALDISARILLDRHDVAWVEEPGYTGARMAFGGVGAQLVSVPVDEEGLRVSSGIAMSPNPRVIYVTPSNHFPLGATMSMSRRQQLLALASNTGAWIIEDDYDSEFRYGGRPLPALQGIDTESRVIYIGTFSKVLLPGLRLGYMVVPPDLMSSFHGARVVSGLHNSLTEQAVVADFLAEGHLARHLRRMRSIYSSRRDVLVDALGRELSDCLHVTTPDAGMHVVARLRNGMTDTALLAAAMKTLSLNALSSCYGGAERQHGLLLGFAGSRVPILQRGVQQLAEIFARVKRA